MRIKNYYPTYCKCIDRCSYSSTGNLKNSVTKSQLAQFVCKHPVSYVYSYWYAYIHMYYWLNKIFKKLLYLTACTMHLFNQLSYCKKGYIIIIVLFFTHITQNTSFAIYHQALGKLEDCWSCYALTDKVLAIY